MWMPVALLMAEFQDVANNLYRSCFVARVQSAIVGSSFHICHHPVVFGGKGFVFQGFLVVAIC